jgi:hypothetical protein
MYTRAVLIAKINAVTHCGMTTLPRMLKKDALAFMTTASMKSKFDDVYVNEKLFSKFPLSAVFASRA